MTPLETAEEIVAYLTAPDKPAFRHAWDSATDEVRDEILTRVMSIISQSSGHPRAD